ncbi:methionyl-tRNA formyltransferase [Microbacteriaceae bacterium MWH-Ta3]|nr:methionyl-tRNA formyltransferase [Microbacteriaceae bacterium MWH-Ta3]
MSRSLVFAGSPPVAVPYLDALVAAGFDVTMVITREDSPVGRKRVLTPTAVANAAERLGIPVVKANRLTNVHVPDGTELGVVVAYGGLVPDSLLAEPVHGWLNVHFSELPRWRGAAPLQRAMMAGENSVGVTIFRLVSELDAGDVAHVTPVALGDYETATEALERIARFTASDLSYVVESVCAGEAVFRPQVGTPTFAAKLSRSDGRIDWASPSTRIDAIIRGVTSEPGAYSTVDGNSMGIVRAVVGPTENEWDAAIGSVAVRDRRVLVRCAEGTIELMRVKPAGKGEMSAADWARGLNTAVIFE